MGTFLLYGAYGYTGQLIIEEALSKGIRPVLSGRDASKLKALQEQTGLEILPLSLDQPDELVKALQSFPVVVHAAGPFSQTAKPMVKACLAAGCHYLDITGEIAVFEWVKKQNDAALQKNIMLMPGVGFDVVPTDCMALWLKNLLPNATHLQLGFATKGGRLSHGTATTMAMGMGEGGAIRKDGKIISHPLGRFARTISWGSFRRQLMSIPWGDVSTAHFTTGIPNIVTYTQASPGTVRLLRFQLLFNWVLRLPFVKKRALQKIKQQPAGPSAQQRKKARTYVWGEASNAQGEKVERRFSTPEGYSLTAQSAVLIAQKVLGGQWKAGYQTPAACYGQNLVHEIPGVETMEA